MLERIAISAVAAGTTTLIFFVTVVVVNALGVKASGIRVILGFAVSGLFFDKLVRPWL